MLLKKYLITLAAVSMIGCGLKDEDPTARENDSINKPDQLNGYQGNGETVEFEQYAQDAELVSASVMSVGDEATSSLADGDSDMTGATSLSLAGEIARNVVRERSCEKPEDDVVVSIHRGMEQTVSRVARRGSLERYFKFDSNIKRTWSNELNDLECHENGKHINLSAVDFNSSVKLTAEFTREKTQWIKLTNNVRNIEKTTQHAFKSEGSRQVEWQSLTEDEETSTATEERTVKIEANRKFEITKADGKVFGFETTISTDAESPLVQSIERDLETREAKKRTIKSGKLIAVRKDKGRLETTFDNVVYDVESACMPVSGKLSGALYKDGEAEAVRSYSIEFNGTDAQITFANGETAEYIPEGCELEDVALNDAAEVTEEAAE